MLGGKLGQALELLAVLVPDQTAREELGLVLLLVGGNLLLHLPTVKKRRPMGSVIERRSRDLKKLSGVSV